MAARNCETETNKLVILAAICLAALVLPLSFSGGAVATPAIGQHLGGNPVALNWITNAFMLTFGSSLMAAGTLADRFGRKRLFTVGIGAFTCLSLLVSMAPSVVALDLLRAVQGFAVAAALSGGSAALAQEFEGHARTKAFSALGTTFGVGLAFGPLLAGLLIETIGWRSVFLSSAMVGAMSLIFGLPRMRESRDPHAAQVDWPGTITFTGTLTLFTFAVIQGPESGWINPKVIALFLGSIIMLAAFVTIERRVARPMLDLSLFLYPRFVGVQTLPIATCYCYVVLLVLLPLRFIGIEGRSPIDAGLLLLALSAPMLIVPFLAATLTHWFSAGVLSGIGLLIAALGLFLLSRIDPGQGGASMIVPMLVIGCGTGLPWGLMDGLSVSVVPTERAGMATGIFSTTRVAGEGIALAIVTATLAELTRAHLQALGLPAGSRLGDVAQSLANGDVGAASHLLPGVGRAVFVKSYTASFQNLIYFLISITIAFAIAVFVFLRQKHTAD
ncbi:MAG: MFS transporter [Gluconacetobacter sp.]